MQNKHDRTTMKITLIKLEVKLICVIFMAGILHVNVMLCSSE